MINPIPLIRAAYPYIVFGYQLIRDEVKKARNEPPPMPLPYTAVRRINEASKAFDHTPKKP